MASALVCVLAFFWLYCMGFTIVCALTAIDVILDIRYDTRCYFNVRSKADISQLNLPHGTDN